MQIEQKLTAAVVAAVKALYGQDVPETIVQLGATKKEFEGHLTLIVFPFLKMSRKRPEDTAEEIGQYLVTNLPDVVARFNVIKGFLNMVIADACWVSLLSEIQQDAHYGLTPVTDESPLVMIEYSSPNTNKPLHLGHVRNNLLGWALAQVMEANGNRVVKTNIVNDRGIHICKSMLAWLKWGNGETPESTGKKGDHLVGDCYVAYAQMEKEDPSVLDDVHAMLVKWEEGDPEVRALWQKMNGWVFDGFEQTYKALGITFDKVYYESQTYLLGKELVQKGLDMGVFVREADGSVWCDLTADGLDRKLLLRSDGTSVYITQDLGTAERRFSEYKLDSHVYVVGDEQNYHFQVLKLILGKLGFAWADQIYHLSYGMVELPEGKMKSREGTVVDADDLIEKMYEEAKATSEEAGKLDGLTEAEKDSLYRMVGLGALKYFIIKVDPKKKMLFNPKESIDFNGNTGPFIQYTHARIKSILRKAEERGITPRIAEGIALNPKEMRLLKILNAYPRKIAEGAAAFSPAVIANFAYDLAKEFNQYYHETPILGEEDRALLEARLVLIGTVACVLRKAMGILGIQLPDRM